MQVWSVLGVSPLIFSFRLYSKIVLYKRTSLTNNHRKIPLKNYLKKYLVLRLLLKDLRHARRGYHPHFCVVSVLLVTPVETSNLVDSGGQKVVALGVLFGFRQ